MKVHYDQSLPDGTWVPAECHGPYNIQPIGEYIIGVGPNIRGMHVECKACDLVVDLPTRDTATVNPLEDVEVVMLRRFEEAHKADDQAEMARLNSALEVFREAATVARKWVQP